MMRIEKETDLWYNIDKKLTIRGKKRGENYASFSNPGLPFEAVDVCTKKHMTRQFVLPKGSRNLCGATGTMI